jgi:hypothetical protein
MIVIYLLFLLPLLSYQKIIKNINYPSCINCVHYNANFINSEYGSTLNKCSHFGEKNIITDKIIYNYADICRENDSMCGIEGTYFVEESTLNLNMKLLAFYGKKYAPYFIILTIILKMYV